MVELKSRDEIGVMRAAGKVVAAALAAVRQHAAPGVTLKELDAVAADVLADAGARSSFKDYKPHFAPYPFPAVICASVNDAVVHGTQTRTGYATATCSASTSAPNWTASTATPP